MKILQLTPFYSPHLGGVETHVSQLNRELVSIGHQVAVITWQHETDLPLTEELEGVSVYRIPHEAQSKTAIWQWIQLQRSLFEAADIIQVHDVFWWLWPIYGSVRHKVFTTFHGWEGQFPVRWQAKLQRWINNRFSRGTVHIGKWIQEFYWDTPSLVIYGGTNSTSKSLKPKNRLQHIVFVGRLTPENEVLQYSKVFEQLRKSIPHLKITWVGDGPLRAACQRYGQVTGMVRDYQKYLQSADLVFANSYLSLLECQAQAKVVVGVYSQVLKQRYLETYPGVGAMLIGHDPKNLAEQIKNLWSNKAQVEAYQAQAQEFAQKQTWKKVANQYLHLWQKSQ